MTRSTADWSRRIFFSSLAALLFLAGLASGSLQIVPGTLVHRWPVQYFDLFPDQSLVTPGSLRPKTEWNVAIHGT